MTNDADIPEGKRTDLGLYLTAVDAYAKWQADPKHTQVVDVRTPEEYIFVGHAAMAWCLPIAFVQHAWLAGQSEPVMVPNAAFVAHARRLFDAEDTLLVTCRSGGRGAVAVNALAKAGFPTVYNIVDGMEGDLVRDQESVDFGKRLENGWKNAGLPWTYDLDPALMMISPDQPGP